eukprot:scaffold40890_cov62-Attheya_sp.AAC.1
MTRMWNKANLPAFREDESLNSLMTLRRSEYDEPLFCRQCRIPKVTSGTSSWVAPTRVWASVTVDATSNDPLELEVLLPTDGMTRFHVDAHGIRWEIPGGLSACRGSFVAVGSAYRLGVGLPLSGMPGSKIWSDFTIEFRVVVGGFLNGLGLG